MKKINIILFIILTCCIQKVISQNAPVTTVSNAITQGNTTFVTVNATGFTNIGAFDLKLLYNSSIATATSVTIGPGLGGSLTVNLTVPGEIGMGWFTYPGVTLPSNSVILTINFSRVAGVAGNCAITWDPNDGSNVYSDGDFNPLADSPLGNYYINGSVIFAGAAKTYASPTITACPGTQITVPIHVTDFYQIGSFSLRFNYNASVLQFVSTSSTVSSQFSLFNVSGGIPGRVIAGAGSNTLTGVTLPDNTVLFTVTFNYLGGTTPLTWVNSGSDGQYSGPGPNFNLLIDTPTSSYYFDGLVTTPGSPLSGSITSQTNVSCFGLSDGSVTVTGSGGTTPYQYKLGSGSYQASGTFGPLAGGNYTVTIKDAAGCTYDVPVIITQPSSAVVLTATPSQILCFGSTASVVLNASGGTSPYTYNVNNPPTSGLSAGSYTYQVIDTRGCTATATAVINEAPSQLILSATVNQPVCFGQTGSVALSASGGTPLYTYDPANPATTGLTAGSYTYWVDDSNGCQASVTVVIIVPPIITLTGNIQLYNPNTIPAYPNLAGVTVKLQQAGVDILTVASDASGNYSFPNVCSGTYDVVLSSTSPTGGVNATDASQVSFYSVHSTWTSPLGPIEKVRLYAGDVITDQKLGSNDAGRIMAFYVQNGNPTWAKRDTWTFWPKNQWVSANPGPGVTAVLLYSLTITSSTTLDFWGLSTGDFTRNFDPNEVKSSNRNLQLNYQQTRIVKSGTDVNLPIYANTAMKLGAMSIAFELPMDKVEVMDVIMNQSAEEPVVFGVNDNVLRIGWYSLNPVSIDPGETLFTLKLRIIAQGIENMDIPIKLAADPLNEIADNEFKVVRDANLSVDWLRINSSIVSGTLADIVLSCIPNPFSDKVSLNFSLPEEGILNLEVYNMLGEKVKILKQEMESAGDHNLVLDARILPPGVYMLSLQLRTNSQVLTKTLKIVSN